MFDGYAAAAVAAQQSPIVNPPALGNEAGAPEPVTDTLNDVSEPESTSQSSTTYKLQTPFAVPPLNEDNVDVTAPTGAPGKLSPLTPGQSSAPSVGLNDPDDNTVEGRLLPAVSSNVRFTLEALIPVSDINNTF